MSDTWFWRACAVLALLVALGYVVSRFTAVPPVRAGGDGGFIMEVSYDQSGVGKAYVLDSNRKVLLLYGSSRRSATKQDVTLLSSRYIDVDCQATVGFEWPAKRTGDGYSIKEVKAALSKKGANR